MTGPASHRRFWIGLLFVYASILMPTYEQVGYNRLTGELLAEAGPGGCARMNSASKEMGMPRERENDRAVSGHE